MEYYILSVQPDVEPPKAYFGFEKYVETLKWSNKAPLLQSDDLYETMAEALTKRYAIFMRILNTYIRTRCYTRGKKVRNSQQTSF